jgi:hypothetical protein
MERSESGTRTRKLVNKIAMIYSTIVAAGVAYELHCRGSWVRRALQAELGEAAQRDKRVWWLVGSNW